MDSEWSPAQRDRAFEEFWSKYPAKRKVAKYLCRQLFARLVTSRVVFLALCEYIARQKTTEQWRNYRYIPHPSTVLRQRRWEDDQEADQASEVVPALRHSWVCDHDPRCGNRETCAVVASRVCPHTPACAKRTDCLERIMSQWR